MTCDPSHGIRCHPALIARGVSSTAGARADTKRIKYTQPARKTYMKLTAEISIAFVFILFYFLFCDLVREALELDSDTTPGSNAVEKNELGYYCIAWRDTPSR